MRWSLEPWAAGSVSRASRWKSAANVSPSTHVYSVLPNRQRSESTAHVGEAQRMNKFLKPSLKPEHRVLTKTWRPRPESNRCARICSPLRNHSATWPICGEKPPN
jgi:hypothetical protein